MDRKSPDRVVLVGGDWLDTVCANEKEAGECVAYRGPFARMVPYVHESALAAERARAERAEARLAKLEAVAEAARGLFERNEVGEYEGRIDGVMHANLDDFNGVRAALAALDGGV